MADTLFFFLSFLFSHFARLLVPLLSTVCMCVCVSVCCFIVCLATLMCESVFVCVCNCVGAPGWWSCTYALTHFESKRYNSNEKPHQHINLTHRVFCFESHARYAKSTRKYSSQKWKYICVVVVLSFFLSFPFYFARVKQIHKIANENPQSDKK